MTNDLHNQFLCSTSLKDVLKSVYGVDFQTTILSVPAQDNSDLFETSTHFAFEVDVPGFTKEELKISFNDETQLIKVEGSKKLSSISGKETERKVSVSYKLCGKLKTDGIEAKLTHGILTVMVRKIQPTIISIQVQ